MTTLILSPRYSKDSNELWAAAVKLGWDVERVHNFNWTLDTVEDPRVYGEPLFVQWVASQLNMQMAEPPEDFLVQLPFGYVKRKIEYMSIKDARNLTKEKFIKPPNYKAFPAKVYSTGMDLPGHLSETEKVLVSDVVMWKYEARFFILDRKIITWSPYWINGKLSFNKSWSMDTNRMVKDIVYKMLRHTEVPLPDAVVVDAGLTINNEAAIIEANEVCQSGIYGCFPKSVLYVLKKGLI